MLRKGEQVMVPSIYVGTAISFLSAGVSYEENIVMTWFVSFCPALVPGEIPII